jgi:hypothetical protein
VTEGISVDWGSLSAISGHSDKSARCPLYPGPDVARSARSSSPSNGWLNCLFYCCRGDQFEARFGHLRLINCSSVMLSNAPASPTSRRSMIRPNILAFPSVAITIAEPLRAFSATWRADNLPKTLSGID